MTALSHRIKSHVKHAGFRTHVQVVGGGDRRHHHITEAIAPGRIHSETDLHQQ
jgi:imidazoleglycerol phosphate dehydratase HisB